MEYAIGTIYKFKTARFTILVQAVEEDHLDLSWDDDGSVARGLQAGDLTAFCAKATISLDGNDIATDYLGECIYQNISDFRSDGYCRDMVLTVVHEARERLANLPRLRAA